MLYDRKLNEIRINIALLLVFLIIFGCFSVCGGVRVNAAAINKGEEATHYNMPELPAKAGSKLTVKSKPNELSTELCRLSQQYDTPQDCSSRLIVRLNDDSIDITAYGADEVLTGGDGLYIMQFKDNISAESALNSLRTTPAVEYAEADDIAYTDSIQQISRTTSEADGGDYISWGAEYMGIDVYSEYLSSNGIDTAVTVAVIDSGIDTESTLISDKLSGMGNDYINNDNISDDELGHGTHTAGIIADLTRNLPNIKIYPIKVFSRYNTGTTSSIIYAIREAVANNADIINLSLIASKSNALESAIRDAVDSGVTVICSAGNEAYFTELRSPARMTDSNGVIVVSSINKSGDISPFSCFGESVDIAAPGENVNGVCLGGGYIVKSGTSMSAPHISAAVAMLKSEYPDATPLMLEQMIKTYCTDVGETGYDIRYGWGVCDMSKAVDIKTDSYTAIDGSTSIYTKESGKAVLRRVINAPAEYCVEQQLGGLPVTDIAATAFWYDNGSTVISISDTVENIEPRAFSQCSQLTDIYVQGDYFYSDSGILYNKDKTRLIAYPSQHDGTEFILPSGVESIQTGALDNCTLLQKVTVNAELTDVGYAPMRGCTSLAEISVDTANKTFKANAKILFTSGSVRLIKYPPQKITSKISFPLVTTEFADYALADCVKLKTVTASGAVSVGNNAFYGCTSLTACNISANAQYIGDMAFYGCTALTTFTYADTITSIGCGAFLGDKLLKSVSLPSQLSTLGSSAFYGCTGITSVTVTSDIANIGYKVFTGCTALTDVNIMQGVGSFGAYMFSDCTRLTSVSIPSSVKSVGVSMFSGCTALKNVTLEQDLITVQPSAFQGCTSLEAVTLPQTVKNIGSKAFYGCTSLTCVNIPDTVKLLGSFAFYNCTSLADITLGSGSTYLQESLFEGCSALEYLTANGNITEIEPYVFYKCNALKEITFTYPAPDRYYTLGGALIDKSNAELLLYPPQNEALSFTVPDDVIHLADNAFSTNVYLSEITLPNSVLSLGKNVFSGVTSITKVSIGDLIKYYPLCDIFPDSVENITDISINAHLEQISANMFRDCASLENIYIPDYISYIGDRAFEGCNSIKSISLPSTLTYLGEYAFADCTMLENVTIPEGIEAIEAYAFKGCSSLKQITVPNSVKDIKEYAFKDCSVLEYVSLPDTMTQIYDYTFSGCRKLSGIRIPSHITSIGVSAFNNCKSLTDIYIPETVTYIGKYAFNGCSALRSVSVPSGLTEINDYTFAGCQLITDIVLPQGITYLGSHAFDNCKKLGNINIPDGVTVISDYAFSDCRALTKLPINDRITYIGDHAYSGCIGIKSVVLPRSVCYIKAYAFYKMTSLEDLILNEGLLQIGKYSFSECSSLKSINLPSTVETLNVGSFSKCTSLISADLSSALECVYNNSFEGCTALKDISFPDNVLHIYNEAFLNCTSLENVDGDNLRSIGTRAFAGCTNLKSFKMSESITSVAENSFTGCTQLNIICPPSCYIRQFAHDNAIDYTVFLSLGELTSYSDRSNYLITEIHYVKCTDNGNVYYKIEAYVDGERIMDGAEITVSLMLSALDASNDIVNLLKFGYAIHSKATPTDATPTDATPTDATPTDATSTDATPTDATPTDATPTDATSTDATQTDATPTDATPTDATPTDATPTDATPTDATPTDATPTDATPTEPTPTDPPLPDIPPEEDDKKNILYIDLNPKLTDIYIIYSVNALTGERKQLDYEIIEGRCVFKLDVFNTLETVRGIFGDINLDGIFDFYDVMFLQKALTGEVDSTSAQRRLIDVNGDGETNLLDLYLLYYNTKEYLPDEIELDDNGQSDENIPQDICYIRNYASVSEPYTLKRYRQIKHNVV
ncbi:MAG: leucine-rich repeat protein [Acutalibacteraceae bacterium]